MLDESGYRQMLDALREPARLTDPRHWEAISRDPVPVDILLAPSRPQRRPTGERIERWQRTEFTPFDLVRIWHEGHSNIQAVSLTVCLAQETKRACISRCPDGTIQEAFCSDTADDMLNCTELTTLRCGPSETATRIDFIGLPPSGTGTQLPRVRRPETA